MFCIITLRHDNRRISLSSSARVCQGGAEDLRELAALARFPDFCYPRCMKVKVPRKTALLTLLPSIIPETLGGQLRALLLSARCLDKKDRDCAVEVGQQQDWSIPFYHPIRQAFQV